MLPRPGSTTSSNLQRTKSTTSVQERRKHPLQAKPIDPQTARTHALIAAHRAVDRSRSSASTDLVRSESVLSAKSLFSRHEQVSFSPATHLKRQRSTLQTRVPRLADTLQLPGKQNRPTQYQIQNDSDYETLFGISGENYGAEPSSYRRLRKSRSSLSPMRRSNQGSDGTSETRLARDQTLRTVRSQMTLHSPSFKLRLKRSLSFLRSNDTATNRVTTTPAKLACPNSYSAEAIALARNHCFEGPAQQHVSTKPSMLFLSRAKRTERALRKNTESPELDASSPNRAQSANDPKPLILKKRSLSASITDKVKKILGKSRKDDGIPPQQLEASRPHFGADVFGASPDAGFDSYLENDTPSTKRSSVYVPVGPHPRSCDDVVGILQCVRPSDSCQSLSSQSKSRVTSWTDSTATGSVSARPETVEQKRLSIIKEDGGPHQPSCSAGRHIGGVTAFQQPLSIPEGQTVNSQRIYSALLKRIDEEQKEMEKTQAALKEIHDAQDQNEIVGHYLFSAPTIRKVPSKGSLTHSEHRDDRPDDRTRLPSQIKARTISSSESLRPVVSPNMSEQPNQVPFPPLTNKQRSKSKSPFRQYLDSRKSQNNLNDSQKSDNETSYTTIGVGSVYGHLGSRKFSQSADSVYSRTTNGGINPEYVPPVLSTEDLPPQKATMADTMSAFRARMTPNKCPPTSDKVRTGGAAGSNGPWQDWMDCQKDKTLSAREDLNLYGHVREHAQIDPDDIMIGRSTNQIHHQQASTDYTRHETSRISLLKGRSPERLAPSDAACGGGRFQSPSLQLKEVSQNHISAPVQTMSMKRSQSALLDRTDKEEQIAKSNTTSLRKSSPSQIALMLRSRRSQPAFTKRSPPGKENSPISTKGTPPLSTPGRYRSDTRSGYDASRLRKGGSAIDLQHRRGQLDAEENLTSRRDSPSDKPKSAFSARLSRPFDMDVPERNRPFDSIYLGKRDMGRGNRLSVATSSIVKRQPKSYGNLGPPPSGCDDSADKLNEKDSPTTALPTLSEGRNAERSVSGRSFGLAGKRMLSGLLRGRMKHGEGEQGSPVGESSVFI